MRRLCAKHLSNVSVFLYICGEAGFREFAFVGSAQMIASAKTGNLAIYLNFI